MTDTPDRPDRRPKFLRSFSSWPYLVRWPCGASRLFPGGVRPQRKWLDERAYADLVALCQFLPGPASSQVGMAIGLSLAGYLGLCSGAWTAFTMPSAIALVLFAIGISSIGNLEGAGWLHGLKVAAVAVVALAVLGMARTLTPGPPPGVARRRSGRNRDHGPDCVGTGGCHSPGRVRWPDPA